MNSEQIVKLGLGFEGTLEHLRNGDITIEQLKEMLDMSLDQIQMSIDLITNVVDGNVPESMSPVEASAILEALKLESKTFDIEVYEKDLDIVFNLAEASDKELGQPLFQDFMKQMILSTIDLTAKFNPEIKEFVNTYFKD